jgi:hypothetical protein
MIAAGKFFKGIIEEINSIIIKKISKAKKERENDLKELETEPSTHEEEEQEI